MDAVILVGGEGTRLRPLTLGLSKAMVPILNRPLIDHVLAYLGKHGVARALLALGYQPDELARYCGDGSRWGMEVRIAVESEPLGSGGAIKQFAETLRAPFFALNGDILTSIDLGAMLNEHRRAGADVTIALIEVDDPSGFGIVRLGDDGRIEAFVEKPPREQAPSRWANAGIWLFQPEVLEAIPEGRSMVETDLFPRLIAAGARVQGFRAHGFWVDVGTPRRYLDAQLQLLEEPALCALPLVMQPGKPFFIDDQSALPAVDSLTEIRGPALLGAGARVEAGAVLRGPVVLGQSVVVGAGAMVERSVLWDEARIGPGAAVRGSILARGVVVGAGARVEESVLGEGVVVRLGHALRGASLASSDVAPAVRGSDHAPS